MRGSLRPNPQVEARPTKRRTRTKRETACDHCKSKKIRCNRVTPATCANCLDREQNCTTTGTLPQDEQGQSAVDLPVAFDVCLAPARELQATIAQEMPATLESLAFAAAVFEHAEGMPHTDNSDVNMLGTQALPTKEPRLYHPTQISQAHTRRPEGYTSSALAVDGSHLAAQVGEQQTLRLANTMPQHTSTAQAYDRDRVREVNDETDTTRADKALPFEAVETCEDASILPNESTNWEYHGPRSYLSICSQSGIKWVESRTGSRAFRRLAQNFTADITRRLKLSRGLSVNRMPDPDRETAWRYTSAYFQHALDASMGVVHRKTFEDQLSAYFEGGSNVFDTAWHALRNAIYASGCRIYLSEIRSFHEANRTAWGYFENALAMHTETLLFKTSLTSVQALTVMAYYSQNFGSPCLEYILCNNALALALGKGLHRKPTSGWKLTTEERSQRTCLFWALYCLEKQIEKQSGRPSIINDDEVTCELPDLLPSKGSFNTTYLTALVKLARLAAIVTRHLSSVRVLRIGAHALAKQVAELNQQLHTLRLDLEAIVPLGSPLNPNRSLPGISLQQAIYLHCFYYTIVLDIHNTLIYPWSKTLLDLTPHQLLHAQVERSIEMVMRTCHTATLTLQYVHIDAATPVPLSFFSPIYVLTNLFICILQNPSHERVASALSLMDLSAAFFTRLHVASDSEVPMIFAKDLTTLARNTVEKFSSTSALNTSEVGNAADFSKNPVIRTENPHCYSQPASSPDQFTPDMLSQEELEFERWSMLIPTDIDLDGIDF